jgi:hypothetical protein
MNPFDAMTIQTKARQAMDACLRPNDQTDLSALCEGDEGACVAYEALRALAYRNETSHSPIPIIKIHTLYNILFSADRRTLAFPSEHIISFSHALYQKNYLYTRPWLRKLVDMIGRTSSPNDSTGTSYLEYVKRMCIFPTIITIAGKQPLTDMLLDDIEQQFKLLTPSAQVDNLYFRLNPMPGINQFNPGDISAALAVKVILQNPEHAELEKLDAISRYFQRHCIVLNLDNAVDPNIHSYILQLLKENLSFFSENVQPLIVMMQEITPLLFQAKSAEALDILETWSQTNPTIDVTLAPYYYRFFVSLGRFFSTIHTHENPLLRTSLETIFKCTDLLPDTLFDETDHLFYLATKLDFLIVLLSDKEQTAYKKIESEMLHITTLLTPQNCINERSTRLKTIAKQVIIRMLEGLVKKCRDIMHDEFADFLLVMSLILSQSHESFEQNFNRLALAQSLSNTSPNLDELNKLLQRHPECALLLSEKLRLAEFNALKVCVQRSLAAIITDKTISTSNLVQALCFASCLVDAGEDVNPTYYNATLKHISTWIETDDTAALKTHLCYMEKVLKTRTMMIPHLSILTSYLKDNACVKNANAILHVLIEHRCNHLLSDLLVALPNQNSADPNSIWGRLSSCLTYFQANTPALQNLEVLLIETIKESTLTVDFHSLFSLRAQVTNLLKFEPVARMLILSPGSPSYGAIETLETAAEKKAKLFYGFMASPLDKRMAFQQDANKNAPSKKAVSAFELTADFPAWLMWHFHLNQADKDIRKVAHDCINDYLSVLVTCDKQNIKTTNSEILAIFIQIPVKAVYWLFDEYGIKELGEFLVQVISRFQKLNHPQATYLLANYERLIRSGIAAFKKKSLPKIRLLRLKLDEIESRIPQAALDIQTKDQLKENKARVMSALMSQEAGLGAFLKTLPTAYLSLYDFLMEEVEKAPRNIPFLDIIYSEAFSNTLPEDTPSLLDIRVYLASNKHLSNLDVQTADPITNALKNTTNAFSTQILEINSPSTTIEKIKNQFQCMPSPALKRLFVDIIESDKTLRARVREDAKHMSAFATSWYFYLSNTLRKSATSHYKNIVEQLSSDLLNFCHHHDAEQITVALLLLPENVDTLELLKTTIQTHKHCAFSSEQMSALTAQVKYLELIVTTNQETPGGSQDSKSKSQKTRKRKQLRKEHAQVEKQASEDKKHETEKKEEEEEEKKKKEEGEKEKAEAKKAEKQKAREITRTRQKELKEERERATREARRERKAEIAEISRRDQEKYDKEARVFTRYNLLAEKFLKREDARIDHTVNSYLKKKKVAPIYVTLAYHLLKMQQKAILKRDQDYRIKKEKIVDRYTLLAKTFMRQKKDRVKAKARAITSYALLTRKLMMREKERAKASSRAYLEKKQTNKAKQLAKTHGTSQRSKSQKRPALHATNQHTLMQRPGTRNRKQQAASPLWHAYAQLQKHVPTLTNYFNEPTIVSIGSRQALQLQKNSLLLMLTFVNGKLYLGPLTQHGKLNRLALLYPWPLETNPIASFSLVSHSNDVKQALVPDNVNNDHFATMFHAHFQVDSLITHIQTIGSSYLKDPCSPTRVLHGIVSLTATTRNNFTYELITLFMDGICMDIIGSSALPPAGFNPHHAPAPPPNYRFGY